ncbi:MAG TPA: DNA-binding protein [Candidatus Omnitrophica bacterium]|nr:DNA-binding protein [Candidatus Omnitrophota bacterium]
MRDKFLTTQQVAAYLRINLFTLYRMIKKSEVPAYKIGGQWRIKKSEIELWLTKNSNQTRV